MRKLALACSFAIWATLATICPHAVGGDDLATQVSDLRNAVRRLEKENEDLRSRLLKIESMLTGQVSNSEDTPGKIAPASKKEAWRKLRHGMSAEEVTALLGDPEKVSAHQQLTFWFYRKSDGDYSSPSVTFKKEGMTVYGWEE